MIDSARTQLRRGIAEAAVSASAPELIGEADPQTLRYATEPMELLDYALDKIEAAHPSDPALASFAPETCPDTLDERRPSRHVRGCPVKSDTSDERRGKTMGKFLYGAVIVIAAIMFFAGPETRLAVILLAALPLSMLVIHKIAQALLDDRAAPTSVETPPSLISL